MSLSDLSSRESVLKAIHECDELGRVQFLEKYGFGEARRYFLDYDGRRYDSKAIVGAAHGVEFPKDGPLSPEEFSGGEQTVQRKLEELGFKVQVISTKNPPWSTDELILALDFYFRHNPQIPDKQSKEITELSDLLNQLQLKLGGATSDTYRNNNGVYMKLMNFRPYDPDYKGRGLQRGGKQDKVIWDRYFNKPDELRTVAEAIRAGILSMEHVPPGEEPTEDHEAEEGRLLSRIHRYRERDPGLVRRKKTHFLQSHQTLYCEACGFNFSEKYGERGEGFIECHHTKPLAELTGTRKTKMSDLVLLCSNCHRMVHRSRQWLSLDGLRELVVRMSGGA